MNIVKCERCEKTIIAELFKNHLCSPTFKGFKEIEVDFIGKFIDEYGREVIQAFGMDGITYRIVQTRKERIPTPLALPSDESYHEGNFNPSDDDVPVPSGR